MPDNVRDSTGAQRKLGAGAVVVRLGVIGGAVFCVAAAFAYAGGWLSPGRLTQTKIVAAFEQANGPHPGFRRNHAKGVCATGWLDSNGQAAALSKAALFAPGKVPVVARIAYAGGLPFIPDEPATVRSLALRFLSPNGEEWRTGMINIPVFPVMTAQAFYDQLVASKPDPATGKPDPAKMDAFAGVHPEFVAAIKLIKARQVSSGFADATYNALNTFRFVNAEGVSTPVRWSAVPLQPFAPAAAGGATADKNAMFDALIAEVAKHPVQWRLMITVGQEGDPTADPTRPWPADRKQIDAGTVTIDKLSSEDDGPCVDVNYDPMVLPSGITASDDPIPSARSAAYARSFTLREGERKEKPPSAVTPQEVSAGGQS
ncbi:catalase family peroxidase [Caballeronia humi]|uniref:Catalase-related peroxidase n=1 Tax=Caballeronia humi TaxID=326474 RepID=A0A158G1R5_9BURK|nr:catalase family peroxidase [Caballeronia humi]SAL25962.1 catalase domain-containing protein [Caballeronia humi]